MIRRPPRSTQSRSSAASDVYKRQVYPYHLGLCRHTAKTQERGVISLVHLPALGEALLFAVGHDERPHRARVFHGPAHYLGVDHGVAVVAEPHYMSPAGCLLYTSPSPRD